MMKRPYLILILFSVLLIAATRSEQQWYKGNTHTHTINSDGDSTPDEVVRWYREHGYQFLVLTDHNFLTEVEGLNAIFAAAEKFIVIKGEEVTDRFAEKPIHLNGLDIRELVLPQHGDSIIETLQKNVDAIRRANGVPHINHPNFQWTITSEHLRLVQNNKLFEIYNGHPAVHNVGGGGSPGLEQMWDDILSNGKMLYGIAVDDAHHFKEEFRPDRSNPGRGWVMVRASELSPRGILAAREDGSFYASTGVALRDYRAAAQEISISIEEKPSFKYTTHFIGEGGKVLNTISGLEARYRVSGKERYVRARIVDSMGYMAWTQPVFVNPEVNPSGPEQK